MLGCKDLDCVKKIAEDVLKKEGIYKPFDVIITDLPYSKISELQDSKVKINSSRYESFAVQVSWESEIVSSYLLLAILYAFTTDVRRVTEIVRKYFGEGSIVYKLIEVIF